MNKNLLDGYIPILITLANSVKSLTYTFPFPAMVSYTWNSLEAPDFRHEIDALTLPLRAPRTPFDRKVGVTEKVHVVSSKLEMSQVISIAYLGGFLVEFFFFNSGERSLWERQ